MVSKLRFFAALLLGLVPPMGQVYNGQALKGLALWAGGNALLLALLALKVPHRFGGLVAFVVIGVGFYLFMVGDAAVTAWRHRERPRASCNRWYVHLAGVVAILALAGPAMEFLVFTAIGTTRFYSVPGSSMEPTILPGDHLVADISHRGTGPVSRGDLVLFKPPGTAGADGRVHVKRCVAVAGDLEGTSYGKGVTIAEPTPIATLLATPDGFVGQTVRVDGVITGVCEKRGCWMQVTDQETGQQHREMHGEEDPPADPEGMESDRQDDGQGQEKGRLCDPIGLGEGTRRRG